MSLTLGNGSCIVLKCYACDVHTPHVMYSVTDVLVNMYVYSNTLLCPTVSTTIIVIIIIIIL